ncbi:MAG: pitrilysin family protein [Saprospiraceae bacterium]
MLVDRSQSPPIRVPGELRVPAPQRRWQLRNGIPVVSVGGAKQPLIRLEMIFRAGTPYERKRLVARATNSLMTEGASGRSSAEISEAFDFYGASLSRSYQFDSGNLIVYCLKRHLRELLPLLAEVVAVPDFPEFEIRSHARRARQSLREKLSQSDILAYRELTECVFGPDHPYGYNSFPKDYAGLRRDDIVEHHHRCYHAGNAMIVIAGQVDAEVERAVDDCLGDLPAQPAVPEPAPQAHALRPDFRQTVRPGASQTSLRMGSLFARRDHPDYPGLYVLNNILGGYFGSRLVRNIREEKGYTYDIYSSLDCMRFGGYSYISADLNNKSLPDARRQIHFEMERLQNDLISPGERELATNYLMGQLLSELDGSFNISDLFRTECMENVAPDYFQRLIDAVRYTSPTELRDLAQRYLSPGQFWEVVVGGAEVGVE